MNFSPFAQSTSLKSLSFGGGRAKVAALVATIGSFVGTAKLADAALISDMNNDPQFVDRALSKFGKVGYLTGIRQNTGLRDYVSAVFGNSTSVITTLHGVERFVPGTLSVGTSLDYLQPQNGTVSSVVSVTPMPGAVADNFNTPDVAILRLATPLAGVSDIQFGTVSGGDWVSLTGVGERGSIATGVLPKDGKFRRGNVPVIFDVDLTATPVYYQEGNYRSNAENFRMRGMSGYSGGLVESVDTGLAVGMMVYRTGNYIDTSGTTGFFKFSSPGFMDFYNLNSQVPEPGAALLFAASCALLTARSRRK